MSIWGRVFAAVHDRALRASEPHGLRELRAGLLAQARGRVLELGAGTGPDLEHLAPVGQPLFLGQRATSEAIFRAGFTLAEERGSHVPKAPSLVQPLALGRATA